MFRRKRRFDRIRKMSIEQLADLMDGGADLYCPHSTDGSVYCKEISCVPCIEKWLREEVKNEEAQTDRQQQDATAESRRPVRMG